MAVMQTIKKSYHGEAGSSSLLIMASFLQQAQHVLSSPELLSDMLSSAEHSAVQQDPSKCPDYKEVTEP